MYAWTQRIVLGFFISCGIACPDSWAQQKTLLWKIEAPAGAVYLLGSIHAGRASMYPLPKAVEDAFRESTLLAVEVNILENNPSADPEKAEDMFLDAAFYSRGDTLQKHISQETYRMIMKEFDRYGVDNYSLQRLRPWALAFVISGMELMKSNVDAEYGVDYHFLKRAPMLNKKIYELESMEFQAGLFGGFSDRQQEVYLVSALKTVSREVQLLDQLLDAWIAGDDKLLAEAILGSNEDPPEIQAINNKILFERNKGMLDKVEALISQKGTDFVVVGAGHVIGDQGLVKLLRNKGYKVTRQ